MTRRYLSYEEKHRTVRGRKQKYCIKCNKWKGENQYFKNSINKDGLGLWCNDCKREDKREFYRKMGKGLKTYRRYEEYHRVVGGVKQKKCRKCKRWKTESEFYKTKRNKDGLQVTCKACSDKATNKSRKKRRLAAKN
jgi:hypothetical protein